MAQYIFVTVGFQHNTFRDFSKNAEKKVNYAGLCLDVTHASLMSAVVSLVCNGNTVFG